MKYLLSIFTAGLVLISFSIWFSPLGNDIAAWIAFLFIYVLGFIVSCLFVWSFFKISDQTGEG